MRFMQFRAHDKYALHLSKMEKVLKGGQLVPSQLLTPDDAAGYRVDSLSTHNKYIYLLFFHIFTVFSYNIYIIYNLSTIIFL
jgi:hypothetical protein